MSGHTNLVFLGQVTKKARLWPLWLGYFYLVLSLLSQKIGAQSGSTYRIFSLEQGLPSLEVYTILQDRSGYIWLATDHGIARFDGYEFKLWTSQQGLPHNTVFRLYEDPKGRIWGSPMRGGLFYIEADSVRLPACQKDIQNFLRSRIPFNLAWDKQSNLYISLNLNGGRTEARDYYLARIEAGSESFSVDGRFAQKLHPQDLDLRASRYFLGPRDSFDRVFMLGGDPYVRHNLKEIAIPSTGFKSSANWLDLGHFPAHVLPLSHKGYLGICDYHLVEFDERGQILFRDSMPYLKNLAIIHARFDSKGQLWLSSSKGAFCLPDYRQPSAYRHLFPDFYLSSSLQDKEGNYWFSSIGQGLILLPPNIPQVYSSNPVSAFRRIFYAQGKLWLSSYSEKIFSYTPSEGLRPLARTVPYSEKNNNFLDLALVDSNIYQSNGYRLDGSIWLSQDLGIKILLPSLYKPKRLFLGTVQGLWLHESETEDTLALKFKERVEFLLELDAQTLLVGGNGRLWRYDLSRHQVEDLSQLSPLFQQRFTQARRDSRGRIWLSTRGAGLVCWMPGQAPFNFTEAQGLSSSLLNCLWLESDSIIWLGSNRGLDRLDLSYSGHSEPKIQHYAIENGLPTNGIYDLCLVGDTLWMASQVGLVGFPIEKRYSRRPAIQPFIERLEINGQARALDSIYRLSYSENQIRLRFTGLYFEQAGQIFYRYRLKGLDEDFTLSRNRDILYPQLEPGVYEFELYARGPGGEWMPQTSKLRFEISPPFWEAPWFILIMIGLSLGGIGLIYRWQQWRWNARQALMRAEQKALRAQLNPHFLYNALTSVLFFVRRNDKHEATRYLSKFATLIRQVFENSKHDFISLEQEIESLNNYLELEFLRFGAGEHQYNIEVEPTVRQGRWRIPPMLFQPLVENAVLHGLHPLRGRARRLSLRFSSPKPGLLQIEIEDNGIGRSQATLLQQGRELGHESSGLANIQERLRLMRYYHQIESQLIFEDLSDPETGQALGTVAKLQLWPRQTNWSLR